MLDHIGFKVSDFGRGKGSYRRGLAPLSHGAPGLRPHYHPNDYGAFVRDPDGHNIEAVCHAPE